MESGVPPITGQMGKLRSESPGPGPRSQAEDALSPWVSCPAPGLLLSTCGHHGEWDLGTLPPTPKEVLVSAETPLPLWGPSGGHSELGDGKGAD